MAATFTVACIQNCADHRIENNLAECLDFCRAAHAGGADLICLPENFTCIEANDELMLQHALEEARHPALPACSALARELGVWMLLGSLTIRTASGRVNNRSYLLDEQGHIRARYNKIHLFDVSLKQGETYQESRAVEPGDMAVLADTPWGGLGMSICYDLRFPHLYRCLAQAGAAFITVPAAFTQTTGEAHWHVLQRARAIENGCYVFAPDQCGVRDTGRATYGHSLIIDPWGRVLADGGAEPGFVLAEIDPAQVAGARTMIPSLRHDRAYAAPHP